MLATLHPSGELRQLPSARGLAEMGCLIAVVTRGGPVSSPGKPRGLSKRTPGGRGGGPGGRRIVVMRSDVRTGVAQQLPAESPGRRPAAGSAASGSRKQGLGDVAFPDGGASAACRQLDVSASGGRRCLPPPSPIGLGESSPPRRIACRVKGLHRDTTGLSCHVRGRGMRARCRPRRRLSFCALLC